MDLPHVPAQAEPVLSPPIGIQHRRRFFTEEVLTIPHSMPLLSMLNVMRYALDSALEASEIYWRALPDGSLELTYRAEKVREEIV